MRLIISIHDTKAKVQYCMLLAFGEKLSIDDEITELFVLKFPSSILALVHSVRLFILFL
jgi:hypothetical protein